jgi:single-stranded-DNA-specific exonuclease
MAAGLEIRPEKVKAFSEQFNALCRQTLSEIDLCPTQRIDAWIPLARADWDLYEAQQAMRPFGMENPRPVCAARDVRLMGKPSIVGKRHLRMTFTSGNAQLSGIAFGMGERPVPEGPLDIAFYLQKNTFRGRDSLQAVVRDFRPGRETQAGP